MTVSHLSAQIPIRGPPGDGEDFAYPPGPPPDSPLAPTSPSEDEDISDSSSSSSGDLPNVIEDVIHTHIGAFMVNHRYVYRAENPDTNPIGTLPRQPRKRKHWQL